MTTWKCRNGVIIELDPVFDGFATVVSIPEGFIDHDAEAAGWEPVLVGDCLKYISLDDHPMSWEPGVYGHGFDVVEAVV